MRKTERTQESPSSNEREIWQEHPELLNLARPNKSSESFYTEVMTQLTPPISCHHTNVLIVTLCEATRPKSYSSNSGHVPFPSFSFFQPLPLSCPAFSAEPLCGAASSVPYKHSHVLMMIIHTFQSFFAPSNKREAGGLWSPRPEHVSSHQRLYRDQRPHYSTSTLWRGINQHCPIFHKYNTILLGQGNDTVSHVRVWV